MNSVNWSDGYLANFISLLELTRPKQWYKQSLLFVGITFSGNLFQVSTLAQVILGATAFCAAAGTAYTLNDISDAEADRQHPHKRHRPIASGRIGSQTGLVWAGVLLLVALVTGLVIGILYLAILGAYLGQNVLYSAGLKRVPLVDVVVVAVGFLLRAVAGVIIIDVPLSPWLIISTFQLALLLALAKRYHELGHSDSSTREVLKTYSQQLLDRLMVVVGATLVVSYALYTVLGANRYMTLTLPLVFLGTFRFFYLVYEENEPPSPPSLIHDRQFAAIVACWILLVTAILYLPLGGV